LEVATVPNYAISDGSRIANVIVADSKEIAEEATGMTAIETSGEPWIDWTLESEGWRIPSPFPSWIWSDTEWVSPVPQPSEPGYIYTWNENSLSWDSMEIPSPFPSWIKDENGEWVAPVQHPENGGNYVWDEDLQNWLLREE
jgi:hypothetical protein